MNNTKKLKELKVKRKELLRELERVKSEPDIEPLQFAKDLIKKLFSTFKKGGSFIKRTIDYAKKHNIVVSPIGRIRHLWGYLSHDTSVHAAMDRRGPNSSIQGVGSDIGYKAGRLLQKLKYKLFTKQGIEFTAEHMNSVHDSYKSQVAIVELPIFLYLQEHSMTTQVHKDFRKKYGFENLVDYEVEAEIGPFGSELMKWDYLYETTEKHNEGLAKPEDAGIGLYAIVERSMELQEQELGYNLNKKLLMKVMKHNCVIIDSIRRRELEKDLKDNKPSERMFLTSKTVKDYNLIYYQDMFNKKYKKKLEKGPGV